MNTISVLPIASINDVEEYLVSDLYRPIGLNEAAFCGLDCAGSWASLNYIAINRLLLEVATHC